MQKWQGRRGRDGKEKNMMEEKIRDPKQMQLFNLTAGCREKVNKLILEFVKWFFVLHRFGGVIRAEQYVCTPEGMVTDAMRNLNRQPYRMYAYSKAHPAQR